MQVESYPAALLVPLAVQTAVQQAAHVLGRRLVEQEGEVVEEPTGAGVLTLTQSEKSVAKDRVMQNLEQKMATGSVQTAAVSDDADPILLAAVAAAVATDWLALDW